MTATVTRTLIEAARGLADDVLFPAALEVERTGQVPETHWQRIAEAGLYGIAAPAAFGGPGLQIAEIVDILEAMSGGCLATTFTWIQHHGMLVTLSASANHALRDELLPKAMAGTVRGGVAFAGAVPVPPRMRAERIDGGWRLSGHAPFVSGWGVIDVLQMSAGDTETGDIVAGIVTAEPAAGIRSVTPQQLFVADATKTVALEVDGLVIADDHIVSRVSRAEFMSNQNFGSRLNGTLPVGLVRRCIRLLDDAGQQDAAGSLRSATDAVRNRLDAGLDDSTALLAARAEGAELAVRAASALIAAGGGAAILRSAPAQLLARHAAFTLVAASRPELTRSLVDRLTRP